MRRQIRRHGWALFVVLFFILWFVHMTWLHPMTEDYAARRAAMETGYTVFIVLFGLGCAIDSVASKMKTGEQAGRGGRQEKDHPQGT